MNLKNVIKQEPTFSWSLITADKDDNKFVDVSIASNCNYIVTNDKHFKELGDIDFPKVSVINADVFLNKLKSE